MSEIRLPEGFTEWHTGGGCYAWVSNDHRILITDEDGVDAPSAMARAFLVGLYDGDEMLSYQSAVTWDEALMHVKTYQEGKHGGNQNRVDGRRRQ